jgi:hypothetical protein
MASFSTTVALGDPVSISCESVVPEVGFGLEIAAVGGTGDGMVTSSPTGTLGDPVTLSCESVVLGVGLGLEIAAVGGCVEIGLGLFFDLGDP